MVQFGKRSKGIKTWVWSQGLVTGSPSGARSCIFSSLCCLTLLSKKHTNKNQKHAQVFQLRQKMDLVTAHPELLLFYIFF